MTDPLISVVIPTYNNAETLSTTLDALLNQKLPASEIIIVDDCSEVPVADTLGPQYSDIKIVRHETNQGVHIARNTGYELVTGQYVYFLDSDDIICSDFLQVLANTLEQNKDIAAAFSDFKTCTAEEAAMFVAEYEEADPDAIRMPRGEGLSLYLKRSGMFLPSFVLLRKTALEEAKVDGEVFPRDVWGNEDFHLFVRLLAMNDVYYIRNKMGAYLVRDNNISSNQVKVWLSRGVAFDSLIQLANRIPFTEGEVKHLKELRRISARRHANSLMSSGDGKEAKKQLRQELVRSPSLKTFATYVLMICGIKSS
ncbi:MAG: glycosyltransferase family 2 protein [Proteobacteria bacterium]|nr:glycosyltransferase family 2 protein [Pseudomonadota bacterium]